MPHPSIDAGHPPDYAGGLVIGKLARTHAGDHELNGYQPIDGANLPICCDLSLGSQPFGQLHLESALADTFEATFNILTSASNGRRVDRVEQPSPDGLAALMERLL